MYSKVVLVGILLLSLFVANMLAFLSKRVANDVESEAEGSGTRK